MDWRVGCRGVVLIDKKIKGPSVIFGERASTADQDRQFPRSTTFANQRSFLPGTD